MSWTFALLACLASFVGFSLVVIFAASERDADIALFAMAVSGALCIVSLLMVYTG